MSQMETAGRKQRSTIDKCINSKLNTRKKEARETEYILDAIKSFYKLWLKDCLIEMRKLGYSSNDIKILCEMYKKAQILK